jgi:mRNA interferase MazF
VIVISHDGFNQIPGWRSIIVVPVSTSGLQAKRGPTVVALPAGAAGLSKSSIAVCHQVTTLDRAKLTRRIGVLPVEYLR